MSDQADRNSEDTDDTMHAPPSHEEPQSTVAASGTTTVDRDKLAWSLDNTDDIESRRRGRIVSAELVALLVASTAVITWLATTYFAGRPSTPAEPPVVSTTATKSQFDEVNLQDDRHDRPEGGPLLAPPR